MSDPMTPRQEAERIAKELKQCAIGWVGQARLLGNVRADEISYLCDAYLSIDAENARLKADLMSWTNPKEQR